MIEQVSGCLGTGDLTEWEESFARSLVERRREGRTGDLSEKQIATLERLWAKHFA
jgi:hypothetical protein